PALLPRAGARRPVDRPAGPAGAAARLSRPRAGRGDPAGAPSAGDPGRVRRRLAARAWTGAADLGGRASVFCGEPARVRAGVALPAPSSPAARAGGVPLRTRGMDRRAALAGRRARGEPLGTPGGGDAGPRGRPRRAGALSAVPGPARYGRGPSGRDGPASALAGVAVR